MARSTETAVFNIKRWVLDQCHADVSASFAADIDRYSRLYTACDALETFAGFRPDDDEDDEDLFAELVDRRRLLADRLAAANLDRYLDDAPAGLYLAIPYLDRCSDLQALWLVNKTSEPIDFLGRSTSGVAVYESSLCCGDGELVLLPREPERDDDTQLEPGERIVIGEYSISFDGDFATTHRLTIATDGYAQEWVGVVPRLAGYLLQRSTHGIHPLQRADRAALM